MAELANCVRCNTVFVKGLRDICQNCYRKEEEAFQTVYRFLRERKNREATLIEIIGNCLSRFIKEKRLLPSDFPKLAYPCEKCGNEITSGKLCISCTEELKNDLTAYEKTEKVMEEARKKSSSNIDTYYAIDKHKK